MIELNLEPSLSLILNVSTLKILKTTVLDILTLFYSQDQEQVQDQD